MPTPPHAPTKRKPLILTLFGILASYFLYSFLQLPYIAIGCLWIFLCAILAVICQSKQAKLIFFNGLWLAFFLAAAETIFWIRDTERYSVRVHGGFNAENLIYDKELGSKPLPDQKVYAKKTVGDEIIYDVHYSIDSSGLRSIPNSSGKQSILFFGGSLIFGEGIEDHETAPAQFAQMSGLKAYNFGFPGYGPHQSLRMIETDLVKEVVTEEPRTAIFLSFYHHILRLSGKVSWDVVGPKYGLDENKTIQYQGAFSPNLFIGWLRIAFHKAQQKSTLYRSLLESDAAIAETDIELYAEAALQMKELLTKSYPNLQFHIILFDFQNDIYSDDKALAQLIPALKERNLRITVTESIFDDYAASPSSYHLSPFDPHLTPRAHQELAKYIAKHLDRAEQ